MRITGVLVMAMALMAADPIVEKAKKEVAAKNYDAAVTALEGAYKKNPKSVEVKTALVDALIAKGDSFMYNDAVPPRVKYPTALRAYREVLKYDKANKKATQNIATIEGIYKSMGRPVPE
jgi:hypothetical protein